MCLRYIVVLLQHAARTKACWHLDHLAVGPFLALSLSCTCWPTCGLLSAHCPDLDEYLGFHAARVGCSKDNPSSLDKALCVV